MWNISKHLSFRFGVLSMMGGIPICSGVCMMLERDFDNLRPLYNLLIKKLPKQPCFINLAWFWVSILVFWPIPTMILTKYRSNYIKLHNLMWNTEQKCQLRKGWDFALYQVCSRWFLIVGCSDILLYGRKGLLFLMFSGIRFCVSLKDCTLKFMLQLEWCLKDNWAFIRF